MPADYLLSCKICRYRRMVLPVEIEGEDEEDCHLHSIVTSIGKEIEVARHSRPSKFWEQVLAGDHFPDAPPASPAGGQLECRVC